MKKHSLIKNPRGYVVLFIYRFVPTTTKQGLGKDINPCPGCGEALVTGADTGSKTIHLGQEWHKTCYEKAFPHKEPKRVRCIVHISLRANNNKTGIGEGHKPMSRLRRGTSDRSRHWFQDHSFGEGMAQ